MTSGSSVSLAMGVMSSMRTSEAFVSTAPTITRPMTMSVAGSRSFASAARPTVPPAPAMFSTGAEPTRSSCGEHLGHGARGLVPAAAGVGRGDEVHGVEGCRGAIRLPACVTCRRAGGEAEHRDDADAREGAAPRIPPQSSGSGRRVRPAVRSQFSSLSARVHPRAERSMCG